MVCVNDTVHMKYLCICTILVRRISTVLSTNTDNYVNNRAQARPLHMLSFFLNGQCWCVRNTELSPIGDSTGDNTGDNVVAICPSHCPTGDTITDNFRHMPAKCQIMTSTSDKFR